MNITTIDVIIAVYNGADFIEAAVDSVRAQTWNAINIIIADDGSTDNTAAILLKLSKYDSRIKILSLEHKGVAATLNAAINASTAPYIAFLDADDLWQEDKLSKQMQTITETGTTHCFSLMREFESFDKGTVQTHGARAETLKGYSKITFLGARSLFDTFGLFDENVTIGDFVDWYSRIVRAGIPYIMLEEVLAFRRVHHNNTTATAPKAAFLQLLKMHLDAKRKTSV